jgi:hypothetical protein
VLLRPGEGEIVADEPEKTLRLLSDCDELALTWFRYAGELTLDDDVVCAAPGTFISVPPGVRHGFKNPGPGRARFLNTHSPADGFIDSLRNA